MTEASNEAEAEARRIIIEGLNAGLSLPVAIRKAIDAGIDEFLAQQVGRWLRDDLIKARKRQALNGVRNGLLISVAAFAIFTATVFVPAVDAVIDPIPFHFTIEVVAFVVGLFHAFISMANYLTAADKVR